MAMVERTAAVAMRHLTQDEARQIFHRNAQLYLHMSGEEFLRAYDRGEFEDRLEDADVLEVTTLLPLVR